MNRKFLIAWLGQGLRFGFNGMPGMLAVKQIAFDTIMTLVLGALVAFLYRGQGRT